VRGVDVVLDRTVTADVESSRPTRALAAALTSFAWEIQATVVAEGIERHTQASVARALGVTQGQGYHLGRPAPPPHPPASRGRAIIRAGSNA
jgi:EAL domain-containing protein (putative c-di-GMP-specific phosphodiesterase class I)